ncbi:hypothetical protein BSIN_4287 [Burkholderia singularis]|uniref:Uncharacterized protein n=1 Tax=Burkholderia singularis TaxID=1503053 RepID=A0A238H834_9BURK|nr:hypothetical protein BSIN_4287 [Burkholderia singularis]
MTPARPPTAACSTAPSKARAARAFVVFARDRAGGRTLGRVRRRRRPHACRAGLPQAPDAAKHLITKARTP